MKKECIIAFKVTKDIKNKIIILANQYKINGISQPLTLSDFCRIAINKFIMESEKDGEKISE